METLSFTPMCQRTLQERNLMNGIAAQKMKIPIGAIRFEQEHLLGRRHTQSHLTASIFYILGILLQPILK